jgi:guanylate cyclase
MSDIIGGGGRRIPHPRRWPAMLERMISFAVEPGDRPDRTRTKRLFTAAMWASIVTSSVSVFQFYLFEAPWAAVAVSVPIVSAVVALIAMRVDKGTFPAVMHVVAAGTMLTTTGMIVIFGGVFETAGNTSWAMLAVIGAVAIFADRRAHLWLGVFVTITIAAFLVSRRVEPLYVLPNRSYFSLFNLVTITLFVYVILYYFVRQSARLYRESEMLLRNIFPDEIADRLKNRSSDEMIADEFPSASILFADIVGFTPLAADLEPGETVNLLNEVFTGFDRLVESRGLEKIKTIGDAYMVASGVPVSRDDHARALCELAIDFQEHLAGTTFDGRRLEMRIGIASGPVTAGIIGRRKFSYDMWGDTVNLASRMEVTGTPGRIQVPARTRELVADGFVWEERGVVDVKGRGPVETWYLLRRSNQPLHPAPT